MRRLGVVLGGALLVVIIGAVTITTQVQFGDGKTLADHVPVVRELARSADQGQGPLIILRSDAEKVVPGVHCSDFWDASVSGRITIASPLARTLSDQAGQVVTASQAASLRGVSDRGR
jgi:hypothetical protein